MLFEQWPRVGVHPRPLLDFLTLPNQISTREKWMNIHTWARLDPRILAQDITMRQMPPGGVRTNTLDEELYQFAEHLEQLAKDKIAASAARSNQGHAEYLVSRASDILARPGVAAPAQETPLLHHLAIVKYLRLVNTFHAVLRTSRDDMGVNYPAELNTYLNRIVIPGNTVTMLASVQYVIPNSAMCQHVRSQLEHIAPPPPPPAAQQRPVAVPVIAPDSTIPAAINNDPIIPRINALRNNVHIPRAQQARRARQGIATVASTRPDASNRLAGGYPTSTAAATAPRGGTQNNVRIGHQQPRTDSPYVPSTLGMGMVHNDAPIRRGYGAGPGPGDYQREHEGPRISGGPPFARPDIQRSTARHQEPSEDVDMLD